MARVGIYTEAEVKNKKYTIQDAVNAAKAVAQDSQLGPVCVSSIFTRNVDEKITLVELNHIQDEILIDTRQYKGTPL